MNNVILIKYGELTTKKDNRKEFINILSNNLHEKLKNYDVKIIKEYARMYIYFNEDDKNNVLNVLKNTFGIHAFNLCYKVNTNIDDIKNMVLKKLSLESFKTFKVVTKRRDKNFEISSMEFNNIIGGHILKNIKNVSVDVHNPDVYVNIEINNTDDIDGILEAIIKAKKNLTESTQRNDWEMMGTDLKELQNLIDSLEKMMKEKENNSTEVNTNEQTDNKINSMIENVIN